MFCEGKFLRAKEVCDNTLREDLDKSVMIKECYVTLLKKYKLLE